MNWARDVSLRWVDENLILFLLFYTIKGIYEVVHIFGHPSLPKRSWYFVTFLRLNHDYYFGVIYYLRKIHCSFVRKSALFGARYELSFRECGVGRTSWEILLLR
jgi:hypothetical protein